VEIGVTDTSRARRFGGTAGLEVPLETTTFSTVLTDL